MADSHLDQLVAPLREMREQFLIITEPVRPELWKYCLHLTGSPWDAEDLVQETLLRAFARLSNFWQPLANPRAYLFRIASNTWIDVVRRGRVPLDPLESAGDIPVTPSVHATLAASEAIGRLVDVLPPRQRAVLLLADVFDFTAGEIAAMIGATEGSVRAALHRARASVVAARNTKNAAPARDAAAPQVLASLVDAFNRRDTNAIVALLDENAASDIVGVAEEHGRQVMHDQSLREAMASPTPQRATIGSVAGEPAVLILAPAPDGSESLMWMIRVTTTDDRICTWRSYFFTPELIRHVADLLGVPAMTAGYRYVPEAPAA